ncbi:MAG: hypothetical protein ACJAQT_002191 [Akkermansiaceae bacterium]|jgi:hypothetical protein
MNIGRLLHTISLFDGKRLFLPSSSPFSH